MSVNLKDWNVEDLKFWNSSGKKIAGRNLWISIPALLLAFAVWIMWSMIIVGMEKLGFTFGMLSSEFDSVLRNASVNPAEYPIAMKEQLKTINAMYYSLPAIAGLAGATLRIPNSFLIAIGGGRNTIFITTVLLIIPCVGVGIALQDPQTPFPVFAVFAALSGFGGGNFASSMSNITFFFPKRMQGTALGLNAGLGNLGVSTMQFLLPITMGAALFSAIGGEGLPLLSAFKGKAAGAPYWIQNSGWTWVPMLFVSAAAAFFGMNNLGIATPNLRSNLLNMGKALYLILLSLISAGTGVYLLLILKINMWMVLPVVIILTLLLLKFLALGEIRANLNRQFAIFSNKHNWIMTVIYTMTFGSFIGFSAAFPKLISDVFGSLPDGSVNPNAPNPYTWAFLGPLVGALIRPVGGWISDKLNSGSRVTQWSTLLQIAAAISVAYFVIQAKGHPTPEIFWWPFFAMFMLLFIGAGIGNGSTFRSIPYIFEKSQAGPVLGWTSAVAAYGAFIIPTVFGQQIKAGTPEYAMFGFAAYYVLCLVLNWYFYDRKMSGIRC